MIIDNQDWFRLKDDFCKIEVRHTLERKNFLLIFSFQTVRCCIIDSYLIIQENRKPYFLK